MTVTIQAIAETRGQHALSNRSISASYDTARIFAGFGFGSFHREQADHLAPVQHQIACEQANRGDFP